LIHFYKRFYSLGCLSSCHLRGKKGRREVVFDQVAGGRGL